MGKAGRRAVRKQLSVGDNFETAPNNDFYETENIQDDDDKAEEEEAAAPECPYLTKIVSVVVGCPPKEFKVHHGVLSKSIVLEAQCQALHTEEHLFLADIEPSIFELALCYLYSGDYCEHFSPCHSISKKADTKAAAFQQHSLLYCFARKYQLDRLITLTIKNIKSLGRIRYQSVFSSAKETYKQLPADEFWFRNSFKQETKKALMDHRDLVHEPWLLDTFRGENGNFTFDIFTALTGAYEKIISTGIGPGARPESARKLSRWFSPNISHATYASSADSSPAEWTEGDSTSERGSLSDETDGNETMSGTGYSCVENLDPFEESPCVVQALPEVEPTDVVEAAAVAKTLRADEAVVGQGAQSHETEPPQDVTGTAAPNGVLDLDLLLDAESFNKVERGRKNRRGRYRFSREEALEVEPVPELAFAVEEATPVEEELSRVEEPSAEELRAEETPTEEPPPDYKEAVPADMHVEYPKEPVHYAEAPTPYAEESAPCVEDAEVDQELEPMSAAEEAPAELRPEPLWGSSSNKAKKRAKKRAWLTPPVPLSLSSPVAVEDTPSEPNVLTIDPYLIRRDESPLPDDTSASPFRYASLPVFKYVTSTEELPPDDAPCTRRGFHFARDSRWMECQKCREELSALAKKMARRCNPGWDFT